MLYAIFYSFYFFLRKKEFCVSTLFVYLFIWEAEVERDPPLSGLIRTWIPVSHAKAESQQFHPGLPRRCRARACEPSPTAFLGTLAGSWNRMRAAGTGTGAQHRTPTRLSPVGHSAGPWLCAFLFRSSFWNLSLVKVNLLTLIT